MGNESIKDKFLKAIKEDKEGELRKLLTIHQNSITPDEYINEKKDFTALNIAAAFGSFKASNLLLQNGWSVDVPEQSDFNTPLLLACKFGYMNLIELFIKNKADIYYTNRKKLNCLDMAIVSGHYAIAYYFYIKKDLKIQSIERYKEIIKEPGFDLDLFYSTLINKTLPENAPSFALRLKKKKSKLDKEENVNKIKEDPQPTELSISLAMMSNKAPTKRNCQDMSLSIQTINIKHKNV